MEPVQQSAKISAYSKHTPSSINQTRHLPTMYHKQAGHMSRPPSPPAHIPLSIRTTISPTQTTPQQQGQSSSPPQPPYPSYPLSISSEKFPKALKLYNKWWLEKGLSQRVQESQSAIEPTNRLNIPVVQRAHSVSSPGSSRAYAQTVSNSAYDGVTESVVSFTGEESPGSATPNFNTTGFVSYTGEVVRQRHRRALSPLSKAKAALIRHLVSCWVCRSRRVPCPLEHHDIASLEQARKAKAGRRRAQSDQRYRTSNGDALPAPSNSQAEVQLLGVAHQFHDNLSSEVAHADPQSTTFATEDFLAEIPSHRDVVGSANLAIPTTLFPDIDPYIGYQDGYMLPLGVLRDYSYFCAHLDGLCHHPFEDPEALQTHFETHFAYNRIAPAHRYVCSTCQHINNTSSGLCYNCRMEGTIETWIYGTFIRMPTFQHYRPDGQDYLRNDSLAPFYHSTSDNIPNTDFDLGGGTDNGDFTLGGMNQGGGYYNFQNNNFGNAGSQGDNGNGYNTPRSGGNPPFQGNWARHSARASPLTARYWYAQALQTYRSHRFLILTLLLLVAFTLSFQTHEWLLTKVRKGTPISLASHANLPVFGFVGVLASFATYWSVQKHGVRRVGEARCRAHRRPLSDLPLFSIHYRQASPSTFLRGTVFL